MKYFKYILLVILPLLCIQQISCYGQEDSLTIVPDQTILSEGLSNYLNTIPKGKAKDYGFSSIDEFSKIKTGDPLYV